MKNILLFLTMMLTALIAHSQQKDSILTKSNPSSDSLRAFTLEDRKTMLKIFSDKRYNDSIVSVMETQKGEMQAGIVERDHKITTLKSINNDFRNLIDTKDGLIVEEKKEGNIWRAKYTKQRTATTIVVITWLATIFLLVTK